MVFAIESQEPGGELLTYSDVLAEGSFGTVALAYAEGRGYAIKEPRSLVYAKATVPKDPSPRTSL